MGQKSDTGELLKIIRKLHRITDQTILLERILHEARKFVRADAGTLYIRHDNKLFFACIENDTLFPDGNREDQYGYINSSIPIDKTSLTGFAASTGQALVIDDVYKLPKDLDCTFNPSFDRENRYRTKSQLVIPLIGESQKPVGVLQLINAKSSKGIIPFSAADKIYVSFLADHAALALEKSALAKDMIMRMVKMTALRDPYETRNHATRVGEYASVLYDRFARSRGVNVSERSMKKEAFRTAAVLHDVGKAGLPAELLTKSGSYDKPEKQLMYRHTIYGARLFPENGSLWDRIAREVVLNHHERWNGSGYPGRVADIHADPIRFGRGKRGKEIPLSARIVAIADVYDALISERPCKEPWSEQTALLYIRNKSGKLFDPELAAHFVDMGPTLQKIHRTYSDSDGAFFPG